jgi:autotransporter-associated beta strand protein
VNNVDSGSQSSDLLVSNTQWTVFTKGNDGVTPQWALDRSGGAPTVGGIVLNTQTINGNAPFTRAWITDAGSAVKNSLAFDGNTNTNNGLTQRVYSWNLQAPSSGGDGRNVMSSVVTQQQYVTAASAGATASSNLGRQPALNGDNTALYFLDSSTAFAGIWRINTSTNALTRVLNSDTGATSEPTVVTIGNVDRIYYGTGPALAPGAAALQYIDVNRTTGLAGTPQTVLTQDQVRAFLTNYTGTTSPKITGISRDADGNLYLTETNAKVTFRYDTLGRFAKITTSAERAISGGYTSTNGNTLRELLRTITYSGSAGTFNVPQILYQESTPANNISAITLFKPGDFNRDNATTLSTGPSDTTSDAALFKTAIATNWTATSVATGDTKFDMTGDGMVNLRDVKALEPFLGFRDGDANIDGTLDFTDLNVVRDNYQGTNKTWVTGDFASGAANSSGYDRNAADVGKVDYADLQTLADTWLNVLSQPKPTTAQLDDNGYTGQFRADVISAFSNVGKWTATGGGSWGTAGNWNATIPNSTDASATFGSTISTGSTVTLDAARSVRSLTFNSFSSYTLSGTQTLTFSASSGSAYVTVALGSHTIAAPVVLAVPTNVSVAVGSSLSFTGSLALGSNALAITGDGSVVLRGTVTGNGPISLTPTSTLVFGNTAALSLASPISGGGSLSQTGTGTTTLTGALTLTGTATVTAGKLIIQQPYRPVTGSLVVTGAGASVSLAASPTALNSPGYTVAGEFASITATGSVTVPAIDRTLNKASVVVTSSISVSGTGITFDLGNSDMIVRGGSLSSIRTLVSGGKLKASAASFASAPYTTLAVFSNDAGNGTPFFSSYDGIGSLSTSDVIVKYTYVGDTNLDGVLDGSDYKRVLEGYVTGQSGWLAGDVDNSGGAVTSADFTAFYNAYTYYSTHTQTSLGSGADSESTTAAIPEPGTAALLVPMMCAFSRRRRPGR